MLTSENPLFAQRDAQQKGAVQVPGVPEHKPNSEPPPPPAVTTRQVRDVALGNGPGTTPGD